MELVLIDSEGGEVMERRVINIQGLGFKEDGMLSLWEKPRHRPGRGGRLEVSDPHAPSSQPPASLSLRARLGFRASCRPPRVSLTAPMNQGPAPPVLTKQSSSFTARQHPTENQAWRVPFPFGKGGQRPSVRILILALKSYGYLLGFMYVLVN